MAEEAFSQGEMGSGAGEPVEGTSFESVYESVKTSLPGLGEPEHSINGCLPLGFMCVSIS